MPGDCKGTARGGGSAGREGRAWAQEGTPAPLCAQEGSPRFLMRDASLGGGPEKGDGDAERRAGAQRRVGIQSEEGGLLCQERDLAQLCTTGLSSHGDYDSGSRAASRKCPWSLCSEDTILRAPGNFSEVTRASQGTVSAQSQRDRKT